MKRLFFAVILSSFAFLAQAEIQVQINPSPVTLGDNFQLTLTQTNAQAAGVPDLTVLQKDFMILGTARQVNYTVINGQSSATSQWVVTLKALKAGVLSIPAIKMGTQFSNPMTINVEPAGTKQDNIDLDQQELLLKTSADHYKPYVNQQVLYTVKIYNSKRLIDADYQAPQMDNGLVLPLGDTKRYQTVQNNTSFVVEEQKYAVFPQKSGELSIIAPTFTALVYGVEPQRVKVTDKETKLNVQAIPPQFQGTWLPAKDVRLTEEYENSTQRLSQGSTLVRTITLEAVGIPAQLLPSLNFKGNDIFSVYPEKGTDRNQIKQEELLGRTEVKVTYLFNKPGKIIIPELKLPWFNTTTGKEDMAILAPRSIEIMPALSSGINQENNQAAVKTEQNNTASSVSLSPIAKQLNNSWAWLVALFFACAWLVTLYLSKRRRSGKNAERKALHDLREACSSANPPKARDALLKWAAVSWPDATILNLNDLSQLTRDSQLKKQIQQLSQVLYKKQTNGWRGDELWRVVAGLKSNSTSYSTKTSVLPPINPN